MNTPTHDISGNKVDGEWERDIIMLSRAGFKQAKLSGEVAERRSHNEDYPWLNPDATMVLSGNSQEAPLDYGIVFLNKGFSGERPPSIEIHTALDPNTPDDLIDKINDKLGFFSRPKNTDQPYTGYFQLNREDSEMATYGLNDFELAMAEVKALGLKTVPMPMTPHAVEMMPIFGHEDTLVNQMSEMDIGKELAIFIQDQHAALDVKPEMENLMLSKIDGFKLSEESVTPNHMKMGMKMGR